MKVGLVTQHQGVQSSLKNQQLFSLSRSKSWNHKYLTVNNHHTQLKPTVELDKCGRYKEWHRHETHPHDDLDRPPL